MTLSEFLLARYAEDEAAARAAGGEFWYAGTVPDGSMVGHPDQPTITVIDSPKSLITYQVCTDDMAEHIVRHDPERVLAECEAKRQVISLRSGAKFALECHPDDRGEQGHVAGIDKCLAILALPYATHPDYQQEWKP